MILVIALLGYFCLVGLTVRRFGARERWLLVAGTAVLAVLAYIMQALL